MSCIYIHIYIYQPLKITSELQAWPWNSSKRPTFVDRTAAPLRMDKPKVGVHGWTLPMRNPNHQLFFGGQL